MTQSLVELIDSLNVESVTEALIEAGPTEFWANFDEATQYNCHSASLVLVRSGLLGEPGKDCRVARGSCRGVGGQHSWAVVGMDPYEPRLIVDITLWSYDRSKPKVWVGGKGDGLHRPHGQGHIRSMAIPESGGGEHVDLNRVYHFEYADAMWLRNMHKAVGNLDHRWWASFLTHCPRDGWPSTAIMTAAAKHPDLKALIPIDRLGMMTSLNPEELYW